MKKVDRLFMSMFRDLKITRDKNNPGTNEKPNYVCMLRDRWVSHSDVVRMVRKYQDTVLNEMLLEMSVQDGTIENSLEE